jgi:ABC-type nitrate/sulfonate/bicarbonate transport system substrate-binding protein
MGAGDMRRHNFAAMMRAMLCGAAVLLAPAAQAAEKVVAGSLGGQAPLWAFYIAIQKGFFTAEGIDLELNFAHSGAAVTQQLTAGSLDVALSVGITDPIHAIDKGAALALARIIGNVPPYVLVGKAGLKSIADLKGKTVSIGQVNDITTVYFERMMAAHGVAKADITAVSAGTAAARLAALKAGVADAALVIPPLNFQAEAAGFVTLGVAADDVKDLPFTGMAVRRPWAEGHLALAKKILAVTDKSVAWLADPANRAEAIAILVKSARASKADAEASYDFIRRIGYFEPASKISRSKLRNIVEVEKKDGRASAGLTIDRLVMPGLTELTD